MPDHLNKHILGMNLDSVDSQIQDGEVTYALNANVESIDGNSFSYTNEPSNEFCVEFPLSGDLKPLKYVGHLVIPEDNITIYFLTDDNGNSSIGYVRHQDRPCTKIVKTTTTTDCGCDEIEKLTTEVTSLTTVTAETECEPRECWRYVFWNYSSATINITYTKCDKTEETVGVYPGNGYGFSAIKDAYSIDTSTGDLTLLSETKESDLEADCSEPRTYTHSNCCSFSTIYDDTLSCKLGFDTRYPVRAVYKKTQCDTLVYFVSRNTPPRKFYLYNFANKGECGEPYTDFDCNKARIFPEFCLPKLDIESITSGGQTPAGTCQWTIAYADKSGLEYTDYVDLSLPVPFFERKLTNDTDYITDKAVNLKITHNTDIFPYYNIAVAQTINNVTTYHLIGTYKVPKSLTSNVVYTGRHKSTLDSVKVLNRTPFYETADIVKSTDELMVLADLEGSYEYNFQPLVNNLKLYWETVKLTDRQNDYSNPIVSFKFRGYERDEVYPFGIRPIFKNGKYGCTYLIPNREATTDDLTPLLSDDKDIFYNSDICDTDDVHIPKWKVYNTGSKLGKADDIFPNKVGDKICGVETDDIGEFAYWESTETYPCNKDIWGDLSGKPMRFHKFPDSLIKHIHNNQGNIYPIGVRIDPTTIQDFLNSTVKHPKTGEDIPVHTLICGFQLVRGNRVNNKSVIAKGLLYDVGLFEERDLDGNIISSRPKYFYPNYPFNDLNKDGFISNTRDVYKTPDFSTKNRDDLDNYKLDGFNSDYWADRDLLPRTRYTFHSPNTHFAQPTLGTELKLEVEETGTWRGHFVPVLDHPRYKFLTKYDFNLLIALGATAGFITESDGSVTVGVRSTFDVSSALNTFNTLKNTLEVSIPLKNFMHSYHAIGEYTGIHSNISNSGFKRRKLQHKAYLQPIVQNVQDVFPINNFHRESSVYLGVNTSFGNYQNGEVSRLTASEGGWCDDPLIEKQGSIRANYASIKRTVPNQYGQIETIEFLDTGDYYSFEYNSFNVPIYKPSIYPSFGGDIFINKFSLKRKHPFWTQNMVGRPDQINFDYDLVPNLGNPFYYINTSPDELSLDEIIDPSDIVLLTAGLVAALLGSSAAGALLGLEGMNILQKVLKGFIAKNNLDCDKTPAAGDITLDPTKIGETLESIKDLFVDLNKNDNRIFYQWGLAYLHNIGIATFYTESDVNLDLRHGRNDKEENFYPNVGDKIPDLWLQEKQVPILHDNYYFYNRTYSKQAFENYRCVFSEDKDLRACEYIYPNRVIYSEPSNQEELQDAWTVYKPNNYFDFPKNNGKLISVDIVENDKTFARFENTTEVYNTRVILDSNSPYVIEAGNASMFRQKPVDIVKSDVGYLGTQNKSFITSKYGSFWADAKRGKIYKLSSQGLDEISNRKTFNFFRNKLPFAILNQFPDVDIDNPMNGFGLILGWDAKFERLFVTKKDYVVKEDVLSQVTYNKSEKTFYLNSDPITAGDPVYFYNRSFTMAFSLKTDRWISFYSFLPNYYISQSSHLESGNGTQVWKHNMHSLSYQKYYDTFYPYIIEYGIPSQAVNQTVSSVTIYQDILEYMNDYDYYSIMTRNSRNHDINFTKCVIYNQEQSTGLLTLTESPLKNMNIRMSYPKYTSTGVEILYSKREGLCTFNDIRDHVRDNNNGQPMFLSEDADLVTSYPIDKVLNPKAFDYIRGYNKKHIRSTMARIRLTQDEYSRYKFINHFSKTKVY